MGCTIGLLSAIAATLFVKWIAVAENSLVASHLRNETGLGDWILLAVVLSAGGLTVGLIRRWAAPDPLQGPANAIAAAHGVKRYMPAIAGFKSTLASLVSISCGASVGQYGPLAHLGANLGAVTADLFGTDSGRRSIAIACGTAAAIATAFDAPIAGIVFAHEVILRHFSLRAFAPVTVAASMGYIFTHFVIDHHPIFELSETVFVFAPEYVFFSLIGIFGGLIAVFFMQTIQYFTEFSNRVPLSPIVRPAAAGLVVAVIAWWIPEILGVGQVPLKAALAGDMVSVQLMLILLAKILATALCIGFGFSGGVFSPALLIGVMFGALLGGYADLLFEGTHTSLVIYAACGMVAVVSPVIGAPLTAILIIFELTRSYDVTTAAMVSAVFSNLVSYRVFGRSFFDHQLSRAGYDISMGREKLVLTQNSIEPCVNRDCLCLSETDSLQQAIDSMRQHVAAECCVLGGDGEYLGMLRLSDLMFQSEAIAPLNVEEYLHRDVPSLELSTPIWQAMDHVKHSSHDTFPVLGEDDRMFRGVVSRRDIVDAYIRLSRKVQREQSDFD